MFKNKKHPLFDCVKVGEGVTPKTGYHVQIKGKTVAMFQTYLQAQKFMCSNTFLERIYEQL